MPRGDGTGPAGQGIGRGSGQGIGKGSRQGIGSTNSQQFVDQPFSTKAQNSLNKKAVIDSNKCIGCGICINTCPQQAISMNDAVKIDFTICNGCGICVEECPVDVP